MLGDGEGTVEELSHALALAWRAYHALEEHWLRSPLPNRLIALYQVRMGAAEAVGWLTQEVDPRVSESHGLSRIELVSTVAVESARYVCRAVGHQGGVEYTSEQAAQAALVHDLHGPLPFRDICIDPASLSWQDAAVVRLAQAAYEERHLPEGTLDNARLAVLADALEEAGFTDADILGHLRGPGPHVRGCWPVDLCLGKS